MQASQWTFLPKRLAAKYSEIAGFANRLVKPFDLPSQDCEQIVFLEYKSARLGYGG